LVWFTRLRRTRRMNGENDFDLDFFPKRKRRPGRLPIGGMPKSQKTSVLVHPSVRAT
jgi:hypothetical protein